MALSSNATKWSGNKRKEIELYPPSRVLFVLGISRHQGRHSSCIPRPDLIALFNRYGVVEDLVIKKFDYSSGYFANVQMKTLEQATTALNALNNTEQFGKVIKVEYSKLETLQRTTEQLKLDLEKRAQRNGGVAAVLSSTGGGSNKGTGINHFLEGWD